MCEFCDYASNHNFLPCVNVCMCIYLCVCVRAHMSTLCSYADLATWLSALVTEDAANIGSELLIGPDESSVDSQLQE